MLKSIYKNIHIIDYIQDFCCASINSFTCKYTNITHILHMFNISSSCVHTTYLRKPNYFYDEINCIENIACSKGRLNNFWIGEISSILKTEHLYKYREDRFLSKCLFLENVIWFHNSAATVQKMYVTYSLLKGNSGCSSVQIILFYRKMNKLDYKIEM